LVKQPEPGAEQCGEFGDDGRGKGVSGDYSRLLTTTAEIAALGEDRDGERYQEHHTNPHRYAPERQVCHLFQ